MVRVYCRLCSKERWTYKYGWVVRGYIKRHVGLSLSRRGLGHAIRRHETLHSLHGGAGPWPYDAIRIESCGKQCRGKVSTLAIHGSTAFGREASANVGA